MTPPQRTPGPDDSPVTPGAVPPPLSVAVSLTFLEVLLLVGYGVTLAFQIDAERFAVGATSVAFFVLYGGALGWCAWSLRRLRSWARAPVVLAQLLQVLTASSFLRDDPGPGARGAGIAGVLVGLVVLAGIFHPDSLGAVTGADESG